MTTILPPHERVLSKHRLEGLSDGVFAVVMTLLVLEIKPRDLTAGASDAEIWASVHQLARPIAAYAFTFALTGVFWVMHHRKFMLLNQSTVRHAFLTLAFLFSVSLLPLSISLWVPHPGRTPGIVAYYWNFALIAVTLLAGWIDARISGLIAAEPDVVKRANARFVAVGVGAVCGAVVSCFDPQVAGIAVIVGLAATRLFFKRKLRT